MYCCVILPNVCILYMDNKQIIVKINKKVINYYITELVFKGNIITNHYNELDLLNILIPYRILCDLGLINYELIMSLLKLT